MSRTRWGAWVEAWNVSRVPSADHSTAADLGSSGTAASRWSARVPVTTTSQPEKSSGASMSLVGGMSKATLVPADGWTSVSPAAASGSVTAAGCGSMSTNTCSAASAAAAGVSATTTATGSPTNLTVSRASTGRAICWLTIGIGLRSGRSRSAAVNTPSTPGRARASAVSTPIRRP